VQIRDYRKGPTVSNPPGSTVTTSPAPSPAPSLPPEFAAHPELGALVDALGVVRPEYYGQLLTPDCWQRAANLAAARDAVRLYAEDSAIADAGRRQIRQALDARQLARTVLALLCLIEGEQA
jgi:hypothetical protein